jgi:DNA mismatch repair protein MutS
MTFHSILFKNSEDGGSTDLIFEAPAFFIDLNFDQIIEAVTAGRDEYNLKPFFYTPLKDSDAVSYRQAIMPDLENGTLLADIKSFAEKMRVMRRYLVLAGKLYYQYHKEGWFLEAVAVYCESVACLAHDLTLADLKSRGFLAFRNYMTDYAESGAFTALKAGAEKLKADLSTVQYCLTINGNCVKVRKYESEMDYSAAVEATFAKFKQGPAKDYRVKLSLRSGMNHVEAEILNLAAKLYPAIFANLDHYYTENGGYLDKPSPFSTGKYNFTSPIWSLLPG